MLARISRCFMRSSASGCRSPRWDCERTGGSRFRWTANIQWWIASSEVVKGTRGRRRTAVKARSLRIATYNVRGAVDADIDCGGESGVLSQRIWGWRREKGAHRSNKCCKVLIRPPCRRPFPATSTSGLFMADFASAGLAFPSRTLSTGLSNTLSVVHFGPHLGASGRASCTGRRASKFACRGGHWITIC